MNTYLQICTTSHQNITILCGTNAVSVYRTLYTYFMAAVFHIIFERMQIKNMKVNSKQQVYTIFFSSI